MRSNPFLLCSSRFSPTVWGLKDTAWAGEGHGWSTAGVSIALRRSISVQYCFIGSCPLLGAVEKLIWVSASTSAQILPVIWFKLQAPAPAGELLPPVTEAQINKGAKRSWMELPRWTCPISLCWVGAAQLCYTRWTPTGAVVAPVLSLSPAGLSPCTYASCVIHHYLLRG